MIVPQGAKAEFEKNLKAWKALSSEPETAKSSKTRAYTENRPFRNIVRLGHAPYPSSCRR